MPCCWCRVRARFGSVRVCFPLVVMMESADGSSSDAKPQSQPLERKRLNRAPSPARPFLKDGHSRAPKSTALTPKSPKLNKQQQPAASFSPHSRSVRRAATGAKDKPAPVKSAAKSSATKKASKVTQAKPVGKAADTVPRLAKSGKGKLIPLPRAPLLAHGSDSPVRVPTGRLAQTDSSSDLSDCPSEPLSDEQRLVQAASSDAESGAGSGSSERGHAAVDEAADSGAVGASGGARLYGQKPDITVSQAQASPAREKPKPEKHTGSAQFKPEGGRDLAEEDLLREIEDLRSENDYLKVTSLQKQHPPSVCLTVFY